MTNLKYLDVIINAHKDSTQLLISIEGVMRDALGFVIHDIANNRYSDLTHRIESLHIESFKYTNNYKIESLKLVYAPVLSYYLIEIFRPIKYASIPINNLSTIIDCLSSWNLSDVNEEIDATKRQIFYEQNKWNNPLRNYY